MGYPSIRNAMDIATKGSNFDVTARDFEIYVKSGKQKIVTRSSTESELALSQVLWTREYLLQAGLEIGPAVVYQDNQSAIFIAAKGRSTSERSRHIKIRYFFVAHYIATNEIKIEYMPTGQMNAETRYNPQLGSNPPRKPEEERTRIF